MKYTGTVILLLRSQHKRTVTLCAAFSKCQTHRVTVILPRKVPASPV